MATITTAARKKTTVYTKEQLFFLISKMEDEILRDYFYAQEFHFIESKPYGAAGRYKCVKTGKIYEEKPVAFFETNGGHKTTIYDVDGIAYCFRFRKIKDTSLYIYNNEYVVNFKEDKATHSRIFFPNKNTTSIKEIEIFEDIVVITTSGYSEYRKYQPSKTTFELNIYEKSSGERVKISNQEYENISDFDHVKISPCGNLEYRLEFSKNNIKSKINEVKLTLLPNIYPGYRSRMCYFLQEDKGFVSFEYLL